MNNGAAIRILAVDDHPLFRQGVAWLIAGEADMTLVGEASNGREAIQQFQAQRPDVTLMALQMPELSGLEAIVAIRKEFPQARIIVLSACDGDELVVCAVKAGAQGYMLKNLTHKQLLETIRTVHSGKKIICREAACQLAEHATDEALTPAEICVLRLIAAGKANRQIASQLSIAEDTVKNKVKNILSKLGAHDRTHAVTVGLKRGIIELSSL